MHLQNVPHLALHLIANVVVAEVDVLAPLVVEVLLSEVCSSCVVDVQVDWELHSDHLLEQVEDVERIFYSCRCRHVFSFARRG